ncbi:hypothetical protein FOA43_001240 [Brettanomyces nanus]|uniref:PPIase cyclophilin-type domain-containing protein n=1 Tax=Eeniella nana TaxID=13502 RepID=A0A875S0R8_EENNA|nr:uncharacterized protein FOA43_001240 [Brettanomyces nanus]QPG73925.1 hypothetical protein FOA43_001240 [Brettanomyces nanus]
MFSNEDNLESITVVFKLFCKSLPNTTGHFLELCRGEYGGSKLRGSYKKAAVTRVVAPEYIVQMGKLVKRSEETVNKLESLVDADEYSQTEPKIRDKLRFKRGGLLCLVAQPSDQNRKPVDLSFFVTLDDLQKYKDRELKGYLIIGELEKPELSKLIHWLQKLHVDENDQPIEPCWIAGCGELVPKSKQQ